MRRIRERARRLRRPGEDVEAGLDGVDDPYAEPTVVLRRGGGPAG